MLNRKKVHNSETLNIQIDSHDQKSYLIELSKDCTKFDLNVECLENSFSKFFILNLFLKRCIKPMINAPFYELKFTQFSIKIKNIFYKFL